jgi:hypothetical protein
LLYLFLKNPIHIIGLFTIVKDTSGSLIFENVVYSLVRTLESNMKKKKKHFSSLSRNPKRKRKRKRKRGLPSRNREGDEGHSTMACLSALSSSSI